MRLQDKGGTSCCPPELGSGSVGQTCVLSSPHPISPSRAFVQESILITVILRNDWRLPVPWWQRPSNSSHSLNKPYRQSTGIQTSVAEASLPPEKGQEV